MGLGYTQPISIRKQYERNITQPLFTDTRYYHDMSNKKSNTKPPTTLLTNVHSSSSSHMSNFYCSNVDPALINPHAVQLGVPFKQLLQCIHSTMYTFKPSSMATMPLHLQLEEHPKKLAWNKSFQFRLA